MSCFSHFTISTLFWLCVGFLFTSCWSINASAESCPVVDCGDVFEFVDGGIGGGVCFVFCCFVGLMSVDVSDLSFSD